MGFDLKSAIKENTPSSNKTGGGVLLKEAIKRDLSTREQSSNIPLGQFGVGESIYDTEITPENVSQLNEIRGQHQGRFAKLGSGLVNAVTGTVLDIGADVGYLLDFENITDLQKSSEEGFGNWFTDAMNSTKEALKLPVYRTEDSKGFSPTSAGWWADAFPSMLSTVSMMIPTMVTTRLLAGAGELLGGAKLIRGIENVTKIANLSGKLEGVSGAVISRHMEALMEGGQTYQDTYNEALKATGDEEKAKQIAGEAAANNYKLNWAALAQDLPEYLLLHKTFKNSSKAFSKQGAKEALKIAGIEGSEEAYQFVTDKEAKRNALINGKVLKDDNSSFGDRMLDYSKDGEFWTSAFLGALGGAGFGLYGVSKDNKSQKSFDGLLEQHKAVLTGDPQAYKRGENSVLNDAIIDNLANGTIDKFTSGLEAILSNPERIKDEDRAEVTKNIKSALEHIEYSKNIANSIVNDASIPNELKKLTFATQLEQKSAEDRLGEINNQINVLRGKQIVSTQITPDLLAYKESKLTLEGIKNIPNLQGVHKELTKNTNQVAKDLLEAYPAFKTVEQLDEFIIGSNDGEFTKLLTNKEQENLIIKGAKEILYKSKTEEGKIQLSKDLEKAKEDQRKEQEKTAKETEKQAVIDKNIKVKEFIERIKTRTQDDVFTPEEQQFYDNNKEEIEKGLKTTSIPVTVPVETEQGVNENPNVINSDIDRSLERTPDTINKTTTGTDNFLNQSTNTFYRWSENISNKELIGYKLLVVTKQTNPELYSEILKQDPNADDNKSENGIWTIVVDKDGKPVLVDGYYVASTLETGERIKHPTKGFDGESGDFEVDVARNYVGDKESYRANEYKKQLALREEIGKLTKGQNRYLTITGKSKGLINDETHSAFENRNEFGNRIGKSVLGRIFPIDTKFNEIPLYLATTTAEYNGITPTLGKLYTTEPNGGRVFDLIPRLVNDEEIGVILDMLQISLKQEDTKGEFNPIDEIKKIISFKNDGTAYQIYVKDGVLFFGNKGESLTKDELTNQEKVDSLFAFIETKRVNVNSKYLDSNTFITPTNVVTTYKEYLLGGENPMFGTDLKEIGNVRFIQTYLKYNPKLEGKDDLISPTGKEESMILAEDKEVQPMVDPETIAKQEAEYKKPIREKRTRGNINLTRLESIAKDKTKLTKEEKDWFKSKFPNIPIELVQGLIQGKVLGQFIDSGRVLLSNEASIGTLYHEAFHAITQLYLTEQEINALYKEASVKYPNKSRIELEEILAEDFATYKKNGKVLEGSPKRNSLFRRILNVIRDLIGLKAKDIQQVYERLDKGYYTNSPIIGNREFSSLNRDTETKRITKEKGTKFVKDVLDSFDATFFGIAYEKGRTPIVALNNVGKIADVIYDEFVDLEAEADNLELAKEYGYIIDNYDSLLNIWQQRLKSNGINLKISENLEDKEEDESVNKPEYATGRGGAVPDELGRTSTLESVVSPVRMLLMSLKQVNKDGVPILNDLDLETTVDFKSTYTYLLKNLVGVGNSYANIYNKIVELSAIKPEFKQLYTILGEPTSTIDDEHMRFQNQFTLDFNKTRTNSIITSYDNESNIKIIDANRQNEAEKVKTIWENALITRTKLNNKGRLIYTKNVDDYKDGIKFLETLGITFDDNTLTQMSKSDFDRKEFNQTVHNIKEYITLHNGDVTNIYKPTKAQIKADKEAKTVGNIVSTARWNYLFNLEAKYTGEVNELSFISADGKTEYSVHENNGLSMTVNAINNAKTKAELFALYPHLNTVDVEGSVFMRELFDENGVKRKGINLSLELHNGIQTDSSVEDTEKAPTRKGTIGDLFSQQITSILDGRVDFVVSSDKTQEWTFKLNYYNGNQKLPVEIESLSKSFNNRELKNIFRGYFKSEVKRIAKFKLDGLGTNIDIYKNAVVDDKGNIKFTVFHEILSHETKQVISSFLEKNVGNSYNVIEKELNELVDGLLDSVDKSVITFFDKYEEEFNNALRDNKLTEGLGFPRELVDKYGEEALVRAAIVTDFIGSVEQSKLFFGNLAFYKDLYKRTSMFAGTKQIGRNDEFINNWLNTVHPRTDGKLADGNENSIVYQDPEITKSGIETWIDAYMFSGFTEAEAYKILGFIYNTKSKSWEGVKAYGAHDESDAMGYGSLDFIMELYRRMGLNSIEKEEAYKIIKEQVWEGDKLVSGRLLTNEEISLFHTLKLQYAGPVNGRTSEIYIPGGFKFTVMPLIPQMVAGRNLSKTLEVMKTNGAGISVFKTGSKFGTIINPTTGKANRFYTKVNNGTINENDIITQSISYQYLGLQVKPSDPHLDAVFSTQFRKTMLINAFANGVEAFEGAKDLLDRYNFLQNQRADSDRNKFIKDLGINPSTKNIDDVRKLVSVLVKSSEDRNLTANIIDSLDVEEVDGKQQLKYSISSMVNKPKIDSVLMALINSRLVRQKFNGDAYVLAPVTGTEPLGVREHGTNSVLRSYTVDKTTGKTLPAQVMVAMSDAYKPLMKKHGGTLESLNLAISKGEVDPRSLQLVGCRIPGQGMNSNEFLTIKEFLPEDNATTMIAHPDIVAKAGSDFDNDKLYTYRANINENGNYIEYYVDNKITNVIADFISHPANFLSLITPNSISVIDPIVNELKYAQYVNRKAEANENPLPLEEYLKSQKVNAKNIRYTDLLKLHKKIAARYKLWLAKDEVGPSAIANAYGPLAQIAGLTANVTYTNLKGELKEVKINLPHNIVEDGKLNLAALKDKLELNNISEINNQLINIIVDAAKDEEPMVAFLNMTMKTLPVYLYLNRIGVPFEYAANFMAQPIISKYLKEEKANNSVFLKAVKAHSEYGVKQLVIGEIDNKIYKRLGLQTNSEIRTLHFNKKIDGSLKDLINENKAKFEILYKEKIKELSLTQLKGALLNYNQSGEEYDMLQYQVYRDFLEYMEQAQLLNDYIRITNVDTTGVSENLDSERLRDINNEKTLATGFINNIDKLIDNTFIKAFQNRELTLKAFSPLYDTQTEQLSSDRMNTIQKIIEDSKKFLTPQQIKKTLKTIEEDFINFVVQNYSKEYGGKIEEVRNNLFKGENSVAKRLLELKNTNPSELTESGLKLIKNPIIKQLFPLIDKAKRGTDWDNVKIYNKRLDTFTSDQLTEAFRELFDLENQIKEEVFKSGKEYTPIANDLVNLGILQQGLNTTPITYLGIIPFEHYNQMVKDAFAQFNKKNEAEIADDLAKFNELYTIQNSKTSLGMYGKDYNKNNPEAVASNNDELIETPIPEKENKLVLNEEQKQSEEPVTEKQLSLDLFDKMDNITDEEVEDRIKKCK